LSNKNNNHIAALACPASELICQATMFLSPLQSIFWFGAKTILLSQWDRILYKVILLFYFSFTISRY
jgi:hypothetical protein